MWRLSLIIVAVAISAGLFQYFSNPEVVRIGTNQSQPFNYRSDSGDATGFAIETVKEAARRAKIHLEWVLSPIGPDEALATGAVDLWPYLTVIDSRDSPVYMTKPWWKGDAVVAFRASASVSS